LSHFVAEADFPSADHLKVVDMGSGKGYLTFAVASLLGARAAVRGVEARPELPAELCNLVADTAGFTNLTFRAGAIAEAPLDRLEHPDRAPRVRHRDR
jgi:predicted RNA methylase